MDAPPDTPPCFKGVNSDIYGDARVELVHRTNGTTSVRATAFVYKDPGSVKFFQFANLVGCTDLTSGQYWPTATNPIAERVYHDPGDVLISGGPSVLTVPRQNAQGFDVLGREHPAGAWFAHDGGAAANDGAQYLTPDSALDVIFTGSDDLPGQVFSDALYLPPTFELLSPGLDPVTLSPAQDLTFSFSTPPVTSPPEEVFESVTFSGPQGPILMCIQPRNGSLVVPASFVDLVRATLPDGGTLLRQAIIITARELDDDGPELVNGCPANAHVVLSTAANGYESPFTIAP